MGKTVSACRSVALVAQWVAEPQMAMVVAIVSPGLKRAEKMLVDPKLAVLAVETVVKVVANLRHKLKKCVERETLSQTHQEMEAWGTSLFPMLVEQPYATAANTTPKNLAIMEVVSAIAGAVDL